MKEYLELSFKEETRARLNKYMVDIMSVIDNACDEFLGREILEAAENALDDVIEEYTDETQ